MKGLGEALSRHELLIKEDFKSPTVRRTTLEFAKNGFVPYDEFGLLKVVKEYNATATLHWTQGAFATGIIFLEKNNG